MTQEHFTQEHIVKSSKTKYVLALISVVLLVAIVSLNFIEADKVIIQPGSAETVEDKIDVNGAQTYSDEGEIRFLTVLVSSEKPSYAEYLIAKYFKNDAEILPWREVNGDLSVKQSEEINKALMKQSQNTAAFVALNAVGCKVEQKGTGALITAVEKNTPGANTFEIGDAIVEINGKVISLGSQAGKEIRNYKPGDEIEIVVERGKAQRRITKTVKLIASPTDKDIAFLGVGLITRDLDIELPVDIKIDPGAVTGPSAGLAFTLSIIDQLTKGSLTGGQIVSATGEIHLEGDVGPVGGVEQKTVAAKKVGTQVLLVPKGEGHQARKKSGSMKVFEVENISQAIAALEKAGGDKLRQMQACPST